MTKFDSDREYKAVGSKVLCQSLDRHGISARRIAETMAEKLGYGPHWKSEAAISTYRRGRSKPPKEWIEALGECFPKLFSEMKQIKEAYGYNEQHFTFPNVFVVNSDKSIEKYVSNEEGCSFVRELYIESDLSCIIFSLSSQD